MLQDIFHFLPDLQGSVFPVFALFRFYEIQIYLEIHSASLTENLMKIFHEDLTFLTGDHSIRKFHMHGIFSCKSNLCSAKQIVLQHIIIPKFHFHAGSVAL